MLINGSDGLLCSRLNGATVYVGLYLRTNPSPPPPDTQKRSYLLSEWYVMYVRLISAFTPPDPSSFIPLIPNVSLSTHVGTTKAHTMTANIFDGRLLPVLQL